MTGNAGVTAPDARDPIEARRAGPALFVVLGLVVLVCACGAAAGTLFLAAPRLAEWHPLLRAASIWMVIGVFSFGTVLLILALVSIVIGRDILSFVPLAGRQAFFLALLPACRKAGMLFRISPDEVVNSFISLYNRLLSAGGLSVPGSGILVLLPRCLQESRCSQAVIEDIGECRRCGRCDISGLSDLMEKYCFSMAVVTGGGMAEKLVHAAKPAAVIAIACEKELVEGIQAVSRTPVVGIVNRRPEGPCKNTEIDLVEFENALKSVIKR